jgi:SAM-dependent methyltransferase
MKTLVTQGPNEQGKLQSLAMAWPDVWQGRILDVGCRSKTLQSVLPRGELQYWGLDLYAPADVLGNLEQGLPFPDAFFDTVVALDVLEHTDNIYEAFAELCRVSHRYVLIALPNAYEVASRIRFLRGQPLSGKYGLPPEPPLDRHRWLFSWNEAKRFAQVLGPKHGFTILAEGNLIGARRSAMGGSLLVRLFPNMLSPWYIALLRRPQTERR